MRTIIAALRIVVPPAAVCAAAFPLGASEPGDWTFSTVTYPDSEGATAIVIEPADVNNDARTDAVVLAYLDDPNGPDSTVLQIFLSTPEGTLVQTRSFPSPSNLEKITVADFDADGYADVAMTPVEIAGNRDLRVIFGVGFPSPSEPYTQSISSPINIESGQLDQDASDELLIVDDESYPQKIHVYDWYGAEFVKGPLVGEAGRIDDLDVGIQRDDGREIVAYLDSAEEELRVAQRIGSEFFPVPFVFSLGRGRVAIANMDTTDWREFVTVSSYFDTVRTAGLRNVSFLEYDIAAPSYNISNAFTIGNFGDDSTKDVMIVDLSDPDFPRPAVVPSAGVGTGSPVLRLPGSTSEVFTTFDVTGDGADDLVFAAFGGGLVVTRQRP